MTSNPRYTTSRSWGRRNILSLPWLKMETLRCYGDGKASDLTGAKTKTCHICLQCIALTFAKLSQCQSYSLLWHWLSYLMSLREVFKKLCRLSAVINGKELKGTPRWTSVSRDEAERNWKCTRLISPYILYSYCRGQVVFLLLNKDVYMQSVPLCTWPTTWSFGLVSLWKDDSWNTCCLQDGMEIFHCELRHL